jgi:hypothetical protein
MYDGSLRLCNLLGELLLSLSAVAILFSCLVRMGILQKQLLPRNLDDVFVAVGKY